MKNFILRIVKQPLLIGLNLLLGAACTTDRTSNCDNVDLFIGTSGDNGQVDPAACVPFGMNTQ